MVLFIYCDIIVRSVNSFDEKPDVILVKLITAIFKDKPVQ